MSNPLFNIQYGLFVITTCEDGRDNGCISNTVAWSLVPFIGSIFATEIKNKFMKSTQLRTLRESGMGILFLLLMFCLSSMVQAQKPDKNFHIFLCFGQSNMEAGARPAEQDKNFNDPRFQFVAAVNMPRMQREMGKWYTRPFLPSVVRATTWDLSISLDVR